MNTRQAQHDMDRLVHADVAGDDVDAFLNGLSPERLADLEQRVLGDVVPDDLVANTAAHLITCSGEQLGEWASDIADYDPDDDDSASLVEEAAEYLASESHCLLAYLAFVAWKPSGICTTRQAIVDGGAS